MRRWLFAALSLAFAGLLAVPLVLGQTTGTVNTIPGSIWTYLGPTFGANWVAPVPTTTATPQTFGCVGDGVTDDTACLQTAINSVSAGTGGVLTFDNTHKYLITSTLVINDNPVTLQGTNGNRTVYTKLCPNGIVVNSNITAIQLTARTGTIRGLCIQMSPTAGTRISGSAIWAGTHTTTPSTPVTGQGRAIIENNTVIYAYNGIEIGARVTGLQQTNSNIVRNNTVISASNIGIMQGVFSQGGSTNGTELRGNTVVCFEAATAAIGIQIGDGGIYYDGANGGPYSCNIGMRIYEGSGQILGGGEFTGVLADSPHTSGLVIEAATGGTVYLATFSNFWVGGTAYATVPTGGPALGPAIDIKGAGNVNGLTFNAGIVHSCGTSSNFRIAGAAHDISIIGNQIKSGCETFHGVGVELIGATQFITVNNNKFHGVLDFYYLDKAVKITSSGDLFTIVGNDWGLTGGTPLYAPFDFTGWTSSGRRAVIHSNSSTSVTPTIVTANTTLPGDPAYDIWQLKGTTPVTNITNQWSGRQVVMIPETATPFVTGGAGDTKICNALTTTANVPVIAVWTSVANCWHLK